MNPRTCLYAASLAVLVTGLSAAAVIYFTAIEPADDAFDPSHTKMYVRELQRFGGKASVLFDELMRWFAGLWEGKSLGITIACLSIALSAALLVFAINLRPGSSLD